MLIMSGSVFFNVTYTDSESTGTHSNHSNVVPVRTGSQSDLISSTEHLKNLFNDWMTFVNTDIRSMKANGNVNYGNRQREVQKEIYLDL